MSPFLQKRKPGARPAALGTCLAIPFVDLILNEPLNPIEQQGGRERSTRQFQIVTTQPSTTQQVVRLKDYTLWIRGPSRVAISPRADLYHDYAPSRFTNATALGTYLV
ncbi:hypothetical protein P154DRAFT_534927 [Amniculicola lignicola CBS 123094]|uniref:Uncharacterized protein n=1 Tax=Amniculicola lignicola CBS 123094 TaxID=1392246 RepID=A0A6A5WF81_9PLEO|nr:hypothetical protein P154DRAFT_534927 [Amniculicola lignicola CBS 123094]